MQFQVVPGKGGATNASLVYRPNEFSFDVVPAPVSGFTTILLDDLNIEVDKSGKVISVWGMCPHTRWKDATLTPPSAVDAEVIVLTPAPLKQSVSVRLTPEREYLPTFVDRNQGWVKIEGKGRPRAAAMVMPGVIVEVGDDGEFCALWLHPQSGILN